MLNAGAGALVGLALLSAIVYNSPRACPIDRAHGGLSIASCNKSLGLRLSDLCVLCRNMVFKTIFIKGGASGLACEWARGAKAPKKSLTNSTNFGILYIAYKRGCDAYVKLP